MNDTANLTYPGSRRIYIPGRLHPDVQVPLREILLSDTLLPDGTTHSMTPCACTIVPGRGGCGL